MKGDKWVSYRIGSSYHSLVCEFLDLLDGLGGSLLEGSAMQLFNSMSATIEFQSWHIRLCRPSELVVEEGGAHTLLWRWMVYSRATTCSMADLPAGFFPLDDISTIAKSELLISRRWLLGVGSLAGMGVVRVVVDCHGSMSKEIMQNKKMTVGRCEGTEFSSDPIRENRVGLVYGPCADSGV
jgi:hypothetical protein